MRYEFSCHQCGRAFTATREDAQHCSCLCRVRHHRGKPPTHNAGFSTAPLSDKRGRPQLANFVEVSPAEFLKMSMDEARDYCARKDAAKRKVNGADAMPEAAETSPILHEPQRPPDGSPLHVLNDYYARKKRWNEQQRHG